MKIIKKPFLVLGLILVSPILVISSSCSSYKDCFFNNNKENIEIDKVNIINSINNKEIKNQINANHIQEIEVRNVILPTLDYDLIFNTGLVYNSFKDRATVKEVEIMDNIMVNNQSFFNVKELPNIDNIYIENFSDSRSNDFESFEIILETKTMNIYFYMTKKEA